MFFSLSLYQGPPRSFLSQLRTRLILSLSVLVLCLLVSSALSVFISLRQQQLGEQKVVIHDTENTLFQSMLDQETGLRGYITTTNTLFLDPYTSGQSTYITEIHLLENTLDTTNFSTTTAALQQFENRVTAWDSTYATVEVANMRAGQYNTAQSDVNLAQGKALFDSIRLAFGDLQRVSDQDLATLQTHTTIANFSALGIALLASILVLFWLWRTFSLFTRIQREHLDFLKEASEAFGGGDLSAHVRMGADLEFNEVGQTFNKMVTTLKDQQKALKSRDVLEQVSALHAILTESLDLSALVQQLFQHMLATLDVQIAALYVYEPANQQLKHIVSHGINPEDIQEYFALGEGLIGRVASERKKMLVTTQSEQEQNLRVRTLLGTTLPASMYHLPLLHGNDLMGVLVVGSLYPMREQTLHVLDVVNSNLASAIHNTQSYEHIQLLAQELAERSRQQEESNRALRQQRDELSVLNSALEEANRTRSQFLSTMSHELRTPLTSIIGFSQMLQRPVAKNALTERQQQNIERILKNAQHLLSLINDVLDLSKIEAGHMDVSTSTVNLEKLLTEVVEETRSIALARNLDLRLEIQPQLPMLETDARKVRQIVLNLLSNALKFTEKGFVQVQATSQQIETEGHETREQVLITVQDSGVGIPTEKQAHIFDAFYQVDNSNSRNYGGTGLGLSIVHELVTLLGGKVAFESQPGQGTTFRLLLPQRLREQRFLEEFRLHLPKDSALFSSHASEATSRITLDSIAALHLQDGDANAPLVVAIDDNPDILHLIAQALEQSPYRLVGVQDSSYAMAVIEQLQPSAITLDVMMPQVNGWQLLHALKANPLTASIPVILLTVLEDRSAGYVLGADEYLIKPVARDTLLAVLHQLISQTEITQKPAPFQMVEAGHETSLEEDKDTRGNNKQLVFLQQESNIPLLLGRLVNEAGYQIQTITPDHDVLSLIEQTNPDLLMLFVKLDEETVIARETLLNKQISLEKQIDNGNTSPS